VGKPAAQRLAGVKAGAGHAGTGRKMPFIFRFQPRNGKR